MHNVALLRGIFGLSRGVIHASAVIALTCSVSAMQIFWVVVTIG